MIRFFFYFIVLYKDKLFNEDFYIVLIDFKVFLELKIKGLLVFYVCIFFI